MYQIVLSCVFSFLCRVGTKIANVDNRIMLGVSLLCALTGSAFIADWQAIRLSHDPCSSATSNSSIDHSILNDSYNESYNIGDLFSNETLASEVSNTSSLYLELLEGCIAQSTSSDHCFWNPQSRVTGDFCNSCVSSCLSEQKSLNFVQFIIGALLVASSASLGFVFISAVTSEITSIESQVYIFFHNFFVTCAIYIRVAINNHFESHYHGHILTFFYTLFTGAEFELCDWK